MPPGRRIKLVPPPRARPPARAALADAARRGAKRWRGTSRIAPGYESSGFSPGEGEWYEAEYERLLPGMDLLSVKWPPGNPARRNADVGCVLSGILGGSDGYDSVRDAGLGRPAYRAAMDRARRHGMLTESGIVTQYGRWYAIASRLGVSMTCLCILAEMYVQQVCVSSLGIRAHAKDGNLGRRLGIGPGGIRKAYNDLAGAGYVCSRYGHSYRNRSGVTYLDDGVFSMLHEHMRDMMVLRVAFRGW